MTISLRRNPESADLWSRHLSLEEFRYQLTAYPPFTDEITFRPDNFDGAIEQSVILVGRDWIDSGITYSVFAEPVDVSSPHMLRIFGLEWIYNGASTYNGYACDAYRHVSYLIYGRAEYLVIPNWELVGVGNFMTSDNLTTLYDRYCQTILSSDRLQEIANFWSAFHAAEVSDYLDIGDPAIYARWLCLDRDYIYNIRYDGDWLTFCLMSSDGLLQSHLYRVVGVRRAGENLVLDMITLQHGYPIAWTMPIEED